MKTELVFILDRSGSMSGLESDTIGGFNSMLDKQKQEDGDARVTTVLFDNRYELLHDRIDIADICHMTKDDYYVRGATALFDAVGTTIAKIENVQKHAAQNDEAHRAIFVIITDGMENSSREYTSAKVRKMIQRCKETYGWEFLFLGANIDAVSTADSIGISADHAVDYLADSMGTKANFEAIDCAVLAYRQVRPISADWKRAVEKDYHSRKKGAPSRQ